MEDAQIVALLAAQILLISYYCAYRYYRAAPLCMFDESHD